MITTFQIIEQYQLPALHKNKTLKSQVDELKVLSKKYKLPLTTYADFIYMEMFSKALSNKTAIEQTYVEQYCLMQDYWKTLEYKERSRLMHVYVEHTLAGRHHFSVEGKEIYIPFFSEQLNQLYVHETAVFELKQYHKLFDHFTTQLVAKEHYGIAPLLHGFSSLHYWGQIEKGHLFYHTATNAIVVMESYEKVYWLVMHKALSEAMVEAIAQRIGEDDERALIAYLCEHGLVKRRCASQLKKALNKKK